VAVAPDHALLREKLSLQVIRYAGPAIRNIDLIILYPILFIDTHANVNVERAGRMLDGIAYDIFAPAALFF